MQFLFGCQQEFGNYLNGHPVLSYRAQTHSQLIIMTLCTESGRVLSFFPHLDVLDGLGRGDAPNGCLAAELLHLLAALRDGRWQLWR